MKRGRITPADATRHAHAIARMMLHGQGADAAQLLLLVANLEYEQGRADALKETEMVGC